MTLQRLALALCLALPLLAQQPAGSNQITSVSGNGHTVVTTTGPQVSGDCVTIDANGNHVDAGSACGSGGGSGGAWGSITGTLGSQTDLAAALAAKQASLGYTPENLANKDAVNGYAGLSAGGLLKTAEAPVWNQDTTGTAASLTEPFIAGSGGVVANTFVKLDSSTAGQVIECLTSDITWYGVALSSASGGSTVLVRRLGSVQVLMDSGTATIGNSAILSATAAGDAHDSGLSRNSVSIANSVATIRTACASACAGTLITIEITPADRGQQITALNGVSLSGLATGLYKFTAGVPAAAVAGTDYASGGMVYNVLNYSVVAGDVDTAGANSTAMIALLATVNTAGGGTIFFPPGTYRFNSQLLFPNTVGIGATQSNIRMTGAGGGSSWEIGGTQATQLRGASVLDLQYQGNNNAKIETEGQGTLQIDNLTLVDNSTPPSFSVTGTTLTSIVVTANVAVATFASTLTNGAYIGATWQVSASTTGALNANYDISAVSSNTVTFTTSGVANGTYNNAALKMTYAAPFLHTTSTTLVVHDNAFIGASVQASQDAIVLGGNTATAAGAQNDPFNGYGTTISHNSFGWLNRGLYLRTYANDVTFDANTFVRWGVGVVAVECNGSQSTATAGNLGNRINNNLFEMSTYNYAVKTNMCLRGQMIGNSFYDSSGALLAYYRLTNGSYANYIVLNESSSATAPISTDDANITEGATTVIGGNTRTGMGGYGTVTAEIPYGEAVYGQYSSASLTTGYPGQFTVADRTNFNARLAFGVSNTTSSFVVDAYKIGTGPQVLLLNPTGGPVAPGGALAFPIANDTSTGTSISHLAKINGVPNAINALTTDTAVQLYIVTALTLTGTTGNALLASGGLAICTTDAGGVAAVNNYLIASTTTAATCHDAGATKPSFAVGKAMATASSGATVSVLVLPAQQ